MTPEALILGATTIGWVVVEAAASSPEPHVHLPREVATGLALLAVHATALVEHLAFGSRGSPLIGAALITAGIALRTTAIRALGPRFASTSAAPDRVVVTGPYRWMRHPSEVGLLAAAGGSAVLLGSVCAAIIAGTVLAPLGVSRCIAEARSQARRRANPSQRRGLTWRR